MGSITHFQRAPRGHVTISLTMMVAIVASFFASFAGAGSAVAQSIDTALADTVPAESVLYVDVDLDQSSDQWTQVYALMERAGLSDLLEQEADASPEEIGEVAEMYEITGSAALVLTSADALATANVDDITNTAMDAAGGDPSEVTEEVPEGLVIVFQPEDPQGLYEYFRGTVESEAMEAGASMETADYNGTTIEYWVSDDPAVSATATALVGDTVVVSTRVDDLEPVIDTINGEVKSLSANENFSQVAEAFTTDSLMFTYVDGVALAEAAVAADPTLSEAAMGFDPSMVGYLGTNVYADESGFRMDTVSISQDGSAPTQFDPTLAGRIPAESLFFINGTDIAGSGFPELFGMFLQMALAESESDGMDVDATPMATPTVDEVYDELENQLGFNIKTDLLDQLTGEWAIAGNVDQIFAEAPDVDLVFVSEVEDETTVADTTEQISFIVTASIDEASASIEDRDVNGSTVTRVTIQDAIAPGVPMYLEWAVVDGEFLVGINDGIENYLNGSGEMLADDPIYQQTMAALPSSDVAGIAFINLDRTIPMIEEAVMTMETSMSVVDNDEACGDYATQEEAQAAYDEDEFGLWNLDLDYDGEACEDFFSDAASPMASPASMTENLSILSIGSVSYVDGDMYRTSSILLIGD